MLPLQFGCDQWVPGTSNSKFEGGELSCPKYNGELPPVRQGWGILCQPCSTLVLHMSSTAGNVNYMELRKSPLLKLCYCYQQKIFLWYPVAFHPWLNNVATSPTPIPWFRKNPKNFPLRRGKEAIPSPCINPTSPKMWGKLMTNAWIKLQKHTTCRQL